MRDSWLTQRSKRAVAKAARQAGGRLESASDVLARGLETTDERRERFTRALIVNRGGRPDDRVAVHKAGDADEPPTSKQLRDPFTTFYVQGIALEPPLPPDRLLNLTEENALHSACLMAKAIDSCGRGWEFAPREGKAGDTSLVHSELPEKLRAAMEDLTPELTFTELLYQAAWEMDAIGWSAWEVVRINNDGTPGTHGQVGAVYPIPSHSLRASLDPRKWVQIRAGRVRYFKKFGAECTINNETGEILDWKNKKHSKVADELPEDYVASELIIFKYYTPRSLWYGVPRWVSSIATIAELAAIREFNVSWFASGGQVDYHMHFKGSDADAAKDLKDQVEQQMLEYAGRGHTKLFTSGDQDSEVAVNKLGDTLREGHFRFRRTDLIKEVLIAHNVPPYRIGWAETGSLGGNAAEEMLGAYQFGAIKPIQVVVEDRLRMTLFDPKVGIKTDEFRFKLKELSFEDVKSGLALAIGGVVNGFITPNQGREQVGLDPDEDKSELNEYYFRGTKLGEQPPAPPGFGAGKGAAGAPGEKPTAPPGTSGAENETPPGATPPAAAPKEKSEEDDSVEARARKMALDLLLEYETKLKAELDEEERAQL